MEQQCGEAKDIPISIRPYAPGDLAACRGLWAELTEWHRYIYESPGIGGPDPGRHFDEHLKRVGAENIWVAEAGGRVVGLAGLIPGGVEAELEPLVVREAYRGMGIGRRLAETVIAVDRDVWASLRLWVPDGTRWSGPAAINRTIEELDSGGMVGGDLSPGAFPLDRGAGYRWIAEHRTWLSR